MLMQTTQLVFPSGLIAKAIVDVIGLLSIPLQGLGLDSDPAILATFSSRFGHNRPNFKCCGDITRLGNVACIQI